MPDFDEFIMRHGEFGVQAIVERLERVEGVCGEKLLPLEQRWNALMSDKDASTDCVAA